LSTYELTVQVIEIRAQLKRCLTTTSLVPIRSSTGLGVLSGSEAKFRVRGSAEHWLAHREALGRRSP
uniref:PH domain-containing protein n=1 Tax=Taenia asiatica TaxID=60517 RepID=A0A0R3VSG1_TAEAS